MAKEGKTTVVPQLRFPEFKGSGWSFVELSQLASFVAERVGTTECIPYTVTSGEGLISQQEKLGRTIAGNSIKNYIVLQPDDFAYNKSATKAFPQGFIARYSGTDRAAVPNSIFTCFRVDGCIVKPAYLDYIFSSNLHGKWLRTRITVGARAHGSLNVSDDDLMALPVPLPDGPDSLDEQRKIAECLTSLGELISAQERKVEGLKTYKRGLSQQLFPREGETLPRLRFPEFDDAPEWKCEQLDSLAKRGSGHTPNKSMAAYYHGGIKWISLADSRRLDKGLISQTATEISQLGLDNSSAVLHPAGSVVLSRDAGVGKSAVMETSMAVSQHFIVWTCHEKRISNWFLYYVLQKMKPVFESIATGSTIKTIGVPFFRDMQIMLPALPEQQKVARSLFSIEARITTETEKLVALKVHRKGLVQQLFPALEDK
ncbi:restriction endonuclease subunit S [Achromobacter pestifer]